MQRKPMLVTDFWSLLQQTLARMDVDASQVTSDEQMNDLLVKWLDEDNGIISQIKRNEIFKAGKPSAQRILIWEMRNRLYQIEETWREILHSLYEPGDSGDTPGGNGEL